MTADAPLPSEHAGQRPRFSVIIPTLNEEEMIGGTLAAARDALGPATELIVVDGGSSDRTVSRVGAGARVIRSATGRGRQLAAGARAARGDVLLFLHADTRLLSGSDTAVLAALEDPDVSGGCFRFALWPADVAGMRWQLLEIGINARTRVFGTATGDQAIFARASSYRVTGGYEEVDLFEDIRFVRALSRQGRFAILDIACRTSARRWQRAGLVRTVVVHWLLRAAHRAGVSPTRLAGWYVGSGVTTAR